MEQPLRPRALIVRIARTPDAGYAGTVQRVLTGETHRFQGVEALVALITSLAAESSEDRFRLHHAVRQPSRTHREG
jgi:hypothetical protein